MSDHVPGRDAAVEDWRTRQAQANQAPPPPPPPGGYNPQTWGAHYAAPQKAGTNGMAVASLVLGILWVWWVGSILATVFGWVALRQIKDSGVAQQGKGMAVAGLVLGLVGVAVLVLIFLVALAAPSPEPYQGY
jgi:hypothetical protein